MWLPIRIAGSDREAAVVAKRQLVGRDGWRRGRLPHINGACTLAVRRFGPGPFSLIFALGFVTPWRWTWAFPILFLILRGARVSWGPDEMIVSALTGIPQSLMIVLALVSLVLGYWFIVTALPRGRRVHTVVPTLVGGVLGGVLWILALGPLLLP